MTASENIVLPKGSLVVVSGATGNIASHVIDQLLSHGYRVRGTVRSLSKGAWVKDFFAERYSADAIELAEVPDMGIDGAFDAAVKGAQGFIHVATPVMQHTDPNKAVPTVVNGALNMLRAAKAERGLTRGVMTSSSGAATAPIPGKEFSIDSSTWNEASVKEAWAPPPYEGMERRLAVYYAAKTQSEQAAWKFMKEEKPGFVLNTVLPNANFGPVVSEEHQGYHSTLGWTQAAFKNFEGDEEVKSLKDQPPQYYINIVDNAMVHVAALIYGDVNGERLFTFAYPYNWNDMFAIFRKLFPEKGKWTDIGGLERDRSHVTNERAEELLKRFSGHGWTSLEDSLKQSIAPLVE
jgi:nucleoside-diphosphate-sugar epimerase